LFIAVLHTREKGQKLGLSEQCRLRTDDWTEGDFSLTAFLLYSLHRYGESASQYLRWYLR